jgi:hypothetical protein
MGLLHFPGKELVCDQCGVQFPKKAIGIFDSTRQGKLKYGCKSSLCRNCMIRSFETCLNRMVNRAVVVEPTPDLNAYVFYSFSELASKLNKSLNPEWERKFIDDMQTLLPPDDAKCCICKDDALFTWCPIEVYKNNDPYAWIVNEAGYYRKQMLCHKCLIDTFRRKVAEDGIIFRTIIPPIGGEGLCTPWDI